MITFKINNKNYEITDNYNFSRNAWVIPLDELTKSLILDYTIMWNMVEHQAYNDSFNKNEKTDNCIINVMKFYDSESKIIHVYNLFKEYISKYYTVEQFYLNFLFEKSHIKLELIQGLLNSDQTSDKLKLLIYSCYRVRCNFFHGPKCILDLDNQKLLFLAMNELLSLISKVYGM